MKKNIVALFSICNFTLAHAAPSDSVTLSGLETGVLIKQLSSHLNNQIQATENSLLENAKRRNALIMLNIQHESDVEIAKHVVSRALDNGIDILLMGEEKFITQAKPDGQSIWVNGNVIFISNRSEKRGLYFSRPSTSSPDKLSKFVAHERALLSKDKVSAFVRAGMASNFLGNHSDNIRNYSPNPRASWSIDLTAISMAATTPSEVCLTIRRGMVDALRSQSPRPTDDEINVALSKACQYGTMSDVTPDVQGSGVNGFDYSPELRVNMRTEWLYLVSIDPSHPNGSRAYVWTRTLGEGAGSGFTRSSIPSAPWRALHGTYIPLGSASYIYNIMTPTIRTGWGPYNNNHGTTANFLCESNPQSSLAISTGKAVTCPIEPRLLNILPNNNTDNNVTVARSQSWNISGTITGQVGGGSGGSPTTGGLSLGLTGGYSETNTQSVTMSLLYARTNSNTTYFRKTDWIPNWVGLFDWVSATGSNSLSTATPLADSLNPQYSTVWQIPLSSNAGRVLQFVSQYESSMQMCGRSNAFRGHCPSRTSPTGDLGIDERAQWTRNSDFLIYPSLN
ncbi:hypothetical protein [Burkholderia territorii]|uniref:hypothetical protein n=1 Tax=Burkholderia territorii TaxID=1503055 RepID=UPI000A8066D4|nr:hypothetical protein [Burkholderia territorii]